MLYFGVLLRRRWSSGSVQGQNIRGPGPSPSFLPFSFFPFSLSPLLLSPSFSSLPLEVGPLKYRRRGERCKLYQRGLEIEFCAF